MSDEFTSPDDLILELQQAAAETEPADAAEFAAAARDELAAYREQRELRVQREREASEDGEETQAHRRLAITIPERYEAQAELFLVFDTFVRFFVDPIVVAASIPEVMPRELQGTGVNRLAFHRFGEQETDGIPIDELQRTLTADVDELTTLAAILGRALFGERFRTSDFWHGP